MYLPMVSHVKFFILIEEMDLRKRICKTNLKSLTITFKDIEAETNVHYHNKRQYT